jgi:uncharacterized membrane protein
MAAVGPLEFLVVAFPGEELPDRVGCVLRAVEHRGDVRIVDAAAVVKDTYGRVRSADLAGTTALAARYVADPDAPLIDAADLDEVGQALDTGTVALAVLVEHAWARETDAAARVLGGTLVSVSTRPARGPLMRARVSVGLTDRDGASAPPGAWSVPATPPSAAADDVLVQLSQLVELAERGVLTRQEFAAAKARVLRHEQWW